jgi:hypothetical protein
MQFQITDVARIVEILALDYLLSGSGMLDFSTIWELGRDAQRNASRARCDHKPVLPVCCQRPVRIPAESGVTYY